MMEPWQGHEIHGRVQGEGRQTAGGIAFLVFVGDERDSRGGEGPGGHPGDAAALAQLVGHDGLGGVEAVDRGRDGRVHRHARRLHVFMFNVFPTGSAAFSRSVGSWFPT